MSSTFVRACVAVSLIPATAIAQDQTDTETPPDTGDDAFLGTIVLSTPVDPTAEDGISVTSEGLALSNPADLSELFVAEPTIAVGGSIPMSQKVYVNGIEENNLAISIDGARQNNKVFHHNTTTLIDPALLKAVRIEPGVASADAGPGALAGALAYETKDVDDLLEPGATFGGRYKFEYDTNGEVFSNSLGLYGRDGGFEYFVFGKYVTGNNREDGDGNDILASGSDLTSGLAKFAYESEAGHRLEFSAESVTDDEVRPYRANIGRLIRSSSSLTRPYELQRENYTITYTNTKPTSMWDPTVRISYSGTDLFVDDTSTPRQERNSGETTSLSGEISNRFTLSWGELNAGIDFYKDEADFHSFNTATNTTIYNAAEELRNVGVFAQVRMEPTENTRFSFGARADFQEFEAPGGFKQSESGLSGNVSGEWDVTDRFTVGAGYSHVWGGLELAENFILDPNWIYPTGGLGTVTADNAYIAASFDAGSWVIDGKVFGTDINNARSPAFGTDPGEGPNIRADVQSRGFELGVSTAWERGFFRLGYANIDTEVNGVAANSFTGNYLTIPLGEFITFQTAHRFDNGVLIGGDAQIALDYDDTLDDDGGSPTIQGYTVFNTFVEYSPQRMDNLKLRMEINNIFDQQYAARATYGQEFIGLVEPLNEPGRSIRLSAEIVF